MKKLSLSLFLFILCIFIYSSESEIYLAGQPEYFPLIEGTHVDAYEPSVDDSGRYVAFTTLFPLIPEHKAIFNYPNTFMAVYLYDHLSKSVELVSRTVDGEVINHDCYNIHISGNGRYVGLISSTRKLVPFTDFHYGVQCYVRDRIDNKNFLVSQGIDGKPADKDCTFCDITSDGRYSLFSTKSTILVENDTNGVEDIYIRDIQADITKRVTLTADGREPNSHSFYPSLSDDGRFVVFVTHATNWLEEAPPPDLEWLTGAYHVVLKDMLTGEVEILSRNWDGSINLGHQEGPTQISDDSRWIAFIYASALLQNQPPGGSYVYLYDRIEKKLKMIAPCDPIPNLPGEDEINVYATYNFLLMSGNGRNLYWYQGENNYEKLEIHRYDRLTDKIDRIVYASDSPRQEQPLSAIQSDLASVNQDGSVFVFTTGTKELTPLYNQGNYLNPFIGGFAFSYRLVLLSLFAPSHSGGWGLFR